LQTEPELGQTIRTANQKLDHLLNANQLEDRLIEQTLLTKNEAIYYGWTKYYSGVIIDVNSDGTYYIHFKEPEDRRINGITDAQIEEDGDSLWNMQPLKEDQTVDGFGFRTDLGQEQYSKDNDINDIAEYQKVINNNTPPLTFADIPSPVGGWDSPPPEILFQNGDFGKVSPPDIPSYGPVTSI
jgi:hypothetical protein